MNIHFLYKIDTLSDSETSSTVVVQVKSLDDLLNKYKVSIFL